MALESINSAMAFQAPPQNNITSKPVKETAEFTEDTVEVTKAPDPQTVKVSQTSDMNDENSSEGGEGGQPSFDQVKKAIETINKKVKNSTVQFGIHDETNRITIKVVDKDTDEVIREVPAEKTLDMIAKAWELAGIVVDEKR